MLQYLRIRRGGAMRRADGTQGAAMVWCTKASKRAKHRTEKNISKREPILIVGGHDSGKTRMLRRLLEAEQSIWSDTRRKRGVALYLGALRPLAAWAESGQVERWWDGEPDAVGARGAGGKEWRRLAQWERMDLLPRYVKESRCVLFIDDAHRLSGRKLDVARDCIQKATMYVVGASQLNRISPSIRGHIDKRKPQVFNLRTKAAYDVTPALMWGAAAVAAATGNIAAAAAIGGLQMLSSGKRSARQD